MARQQPEGKCFKSIIIVAVLISLQLNHCSCFQIEINPGVAVEGVDRTAEISCVLTTTDTRDIVLLQISKDNEAPIVSIRDPTGPYFGSGKSNPSQRFEAQGVIDSGVNKRHLTLTIHYPRPEDAGLYQCALYFVDKGLADIQATSSFVVYRANITEMYQKMQTMETTLSTLLDKILQINDTSREESSLLARIIYLENREKNLSTEMVDLKNNNNKLSTEVIRLGNDNKKMSTEIVTLKNDKKILSSKIVDLDNDNRFMSTEITNLKNENKNVSNEILDLKYDTKNLSTDIKQLENDSKTMSTEIVRLKIKDRDMSTEILNLKNKNKKLSSNIVRLNNDNINMSTEIVNLKNDNQRMSTEIVRFENKSKKMSTNIVILDNNQRNMSTEMVTLKNDNKMLVASVLRLGKDNTDISTEIINIKNNNNKMSTRIDSLEMNNKKISTEMVNFKNDKTRLSSKVGGLENFSKKMSTEIANLKKSNNILTSKIRKLERDSKGVSNTMKGIIKDAKTTSAFSARISKAITMKKLMTIVFDEVIFSHGLSGYNKKTGIFTAPASGLYFFYLVLTIKEDGAEVQLILNNKTHLAGHHTYYRGSHKQWDQSAVNAVVELKAGDQVKAGTLKYLYGQAPILDNGSFTTFGGYLIRPL